MVYYRELDLIGDYCGDKRDHSGQLQEMEYHWCLLWGHEGFTVVYCRDPNIIGDYCGLLMNHSGQLQRVQC